MEASLPVGILEPQKAIFYIFPSLVIHNLNSVAEMVVIGNKLLPFHTLVSFYTTWKP